VTNSGPGIGAPSDHLPYALSARVEHDGRMGKPARRDERGEPPDPPGENGPDGLVAFEAAGGVL